MELPAELRAVLYRHILGSYIHPRQEYDPTLRHNQTRVRVALGTSGLASYYGGNILDRYRDNGGSFDPHAKIYGAQPPNVKLFRLNHQVREEALKAGWEGTIKYFTAPGYLEEVLNNPHPPPYQWLTDLELQFSVLEYFEMFGVSIAPTMHIDPSDSKGHLLQGITGLKTVRLRFPNPYKAEVRDNPLGAFHWYNESKDWFRKDDNYANMEVYPCHRTMVEYILNLAFPFVKHVPNVRMSGCIKTSQKTKWEHIFATEYHQRKETYRTHGYNSVAALADILSPTLVFW
jgi:hypothetical protein